MEAAEKSKTLVKEKTRNISQPVRVQRRSQNSGDAPLKSPLGSTGETAALLRGFVGDRRWSGTCSQLVAGLQVNSATPCCVPRLAIWLRRNETNLWWDHALSVHFSRTGRRRLLHLAPRDAPPDSAPVY